MSKVYGIDLGTTYSAISFLNDNGLPEVIENFADGKAILASAVYFPEGGDPVIGEAAKNQLEIEPDRVVQFVKRQIGKPEAQSYDYNGVQYDPITVSALILKRMVEYAKEQDHDVKNVVITCPAYFGNAERDATRQAGKIAGLNVLNIVNEPTAAAFNYLSREFKESKKIMVYDLGGGTFDISLFDFSVDDSGITTIDLIDSGGDDRLGGADWDARLFNHISNLYIDETGIERDDLDNDGELKQKIRSIVETTKMSLTGLKQRAFTVSHNGDNTRLEVMREKFEEITNDLVDRTTTYMHDLLTKTSLTPDNIDIVLLVGGSTKMPMIKEAIDKVFPGKVRFEDPDQAVAKGAAIAAAVEFNERIRDYIEKKTNPDNVEESVFDENIEDIIEVSDIPDSIEDVKNLLVNVPQTFSEGSKVIDRLSRTFGTAVIVGDYLAIVNMLYIGDESPSEITEDSFCTSRDNQPLLQFEIFESLAGRDVTVIKHMGLDGTEIEKDHLLQVKKIGVLELKLSGNDPAGSPIEFTIRARTGGLDVAGRNPRTNETFTASIESEFTKSAQEMNEAIKHIAATSTRGDF